MNPVVQSIYDLELRPRPASLERRAQRHTRLGRVSRPPPWTRSVPLAVLEEELSSLERDVKKDAILRRRDGARVRAALELLRLYGRRLLGRLERDDEAVLFRRLQLEHRWCYAAAGTTRADFEVVTGRCGAR